MLAAARVNDECWFVSLIMWTCLVRHASHTVSEAFKIINSCCYLNFSRQKKKNELRMWIVRCHSEDCPRQTSSWWNVMHPVRRRRCSWWFISNGVKEEEYLVPRLASCCRRRSRINFTCAWELWWVQTVFAVSKEVLLYVIWMPRFSSSNVTAFGGDD
jgi:hypothetical protein